MISLDGHSLTLEQVASVARQKEEVDISPIGFENLCRSREWLNSILETGEPVYGINTGFGIFADRRIQRAESARLSRNLILSHAVCTGSPMPSDVVRAAMLIRANALIRGHSGIRPEIVQSLLSMLNADLVPVIPSQGSLGSSGDLGPLSHLALVVSTDEKNLEEESGWAEYQGRIMSGKEAMYKAGISRIQLGPKEGLAFNNGATFSAAMGALAIWDAKYLFRVANTSLALSLEALCGCSRAFDLRLHEARGHPGQITVASTVMDLISGSTLVDSTNRVQDAYSLRCAPQVHGAILETIEFVSQIIQREINAATDNPLLFEPGEAISGGNFHGEPVGLVMDYLGIAMAELAAISERRVFRLTDEKLNGGLPAMLVDHAEAAGLNSGLMMPQYTAASLVLENQTLAHPDSVHSLPTSGEQEDHNANSMTAARHTWEIINNTAHVLAVELYTAARAIDLRKRMIPTGNLGKGTNIVYETVRNAVPYTPGDAWWEPEIEKVKNLIISRKI
ncbi:MAG TPA: histidine ammonia-lyase [Anaerolineaceae bacterium]|nr:histidine ammonia-lyase [Anaerolineaceae bacterium]